AGGHDAGVRLDLWRSWHILGGGAGGARPLSDMESTEVADHAAAFTEALLGAGHMLCGLAADLAEAIPPEAYPGEAPGAVVIDMIVGTIRTFLDSVDQHDVQRASDLMSGACDRVLEHLRLALELSNRMQGGAGGAEGRIFG